MINEILKNVKSPFSEELIKTLVKQYIECGCDDNLFYKKVNNLDSYSEIKSNEPLEELINQIYKHGIDSCDIWTYEGKKPDLIYDINRSWVILKSEEYPMKDSDRREKTILYRIYLNLKGIDKVNFVTGYMENCKKNNIPYEFKFSKEEARNDQVVILSRMEEFDKNISIVEDLTSNMKLDEPPMLVGKYKNNIGIGEEYYNRLYSPTRARLSLVRCSLKKYLLDHKIQFEANMTEEEKSKIECFEDIFKYRHDDILFDMKEDGENYIDLKKDYQIKSSLDCAKENIENNDDAYVCGDGLKDLSILIKNLYLKNPESFLKEISYNYKTIATEVWGLSQNLIFSIDTEKNFLKEEKTLKKQIDNLER